MKTILSLVVLAVVAISFGFVQAADNNASAAAVAVVQGDVIPDGDFTPAIDCDNFDCPISGVATYEQCYLTDDCKSIGEDRIKQLARQLADRVCARFMECCRLNGCHEGDCILVSYAADCVSETRLCIRVRVEFKCA